MDQQIFLLGCKPLANNQHVIVMNYLNYQLLIDVMSDNYHNNQVLAYISTSAENTSITKYQQVLTNMFKDPVTFNA